jgi:hypothetical protein
MIHAPYISGIKHLTSKKVKKKLVSTYKHVVDYGINIMKEPASK